MINHKAALHDIMCALHPEYAAKAKALAAQMHAQGQDVEHFDFGGVSGMQALESSVGGIYGLGAEAIGNNVAGPGGSWTTNALANPTKSLTPQNGYQATTPNINTSTNWQGAMNQGAGAVQQGQNNLQNAYGAQMSTGNQLSGIAAGQQGLANNIQGLAGQGQGVLRSQQGLYGQQQGLANQLQNEANGQGPNPAQAQYQQNVDQGIKQQAGAIASTKGINPALAARMAAQGGAQMQQGAAGNEATLQAQQQLAAQGQLASQQQAMGSNLQGQNQSLAGIGSTYGQSSNALGAAGTAYGQQGNIYNQAGGTAASQAGQGNTFYGTNVSGLGNQNNAVNTASLGTQGIDAGVATGNQKADVATQQGALNSAGGAASMVSNMFSRGGLVGHYDAGGVADQSAQVLSGILGGLNGQVSSTNYQPIDLTGGSGKKGGGGGGAGIGALAALFSNGGQVNGEAAKYAPLAMALMARGGAVPGKAAHPGNDPRNDVIPSVLSKGEIVLPNAITQSPDAARKAAEFVEQLKAETHPTYGSVVKARAALAAAKAKHQKMTGVAA